MARSWEPVVAGRAERVPEWVRGRGGTQRSVWIVVSIAGAEVMLPSIGISKPLAALQQRAMPNGEQGTRCHRLTLGEGLNAN